MMVLQKFRPKRFPQFLLVCAFVLSLVIHGCLAGGNRELPTLRVGMNNWPGYMVALYAKEAGLFQKRGLQVELVRFTNQQDNIRATIRGSLDASFVPLWEAMQVDPGNDRPAYVMVADISHGSDGIVARSSVPSVKDLRGKTVAAKLGTVSHLILLEALQSQQLKPTDVKIKDVSNDIAVQLLSKGEVDAAVVWEPLLSETAAKIKGKVIFTTKDVDSLVIDGLATRASFAAAHQAELTQLMLAWLDAIHAVDTQPDRVFASIARQLGQTPESVAKDYSGLLKGGVELNRRMFEGRLEAAKNEIVQLLKLDPRHRQVIREDIEFDRGPMMTAIEQWKP